MWFGSSAVVWTYTCDGVVPASGVTVAEVGVEEVGLF